MINLRESVASLRRDSAARAQLIQTVVWLSPVFWIALWLVARVLRDGGQISAEGYTWLLRLNVLVALFLGMFAARIFRLVAEALARTVSAGGSLKPEASFSLEESMIARGNIDSARATLTARLTGGAEDPAVQLRLADLESRLAHDPVAAERWYLAARKGPCDDRQRAAIANGLIDVYRASHQTGRLMVELARFAEAYPGTRAAEDARRELQELKRDIG